MTDIFIIDKTIILDRFVNEGNKSLKSNPIRFKNKAYQATIEEMAKIIYQYLVTKHLL